MMVLFDGRPRVRKISGVELLVSLRHGQWLERN